MCSIGFTYLTKLSQSSLPWLSSAPLTLDLKLTTTHEHMKLGSMPLPLQFIFGQFANLEHRRCHQHQAEVFIFVVCHATSS